MSPRWPAGERGVTPVIPLVAVTVVLAAVVGADAPSLGANQQTAPQASFEVATQGTVGAPDELRVTHASGDRVPNDELCVVSTAGVQDTPGSPGPADRLTFAQLGDDGSAVGAGDSVLVEPPNDDSDVDDVVRRV